MHGKIYNNITELIGRTPLVRLNRIVPAGAAHRFRNAGKTPAQTLNVYAPPAY